MGMGGWKMKKQIIFLIGWDAAFYIFLYMMSGIDNVAEKAYYRMGNPYLSFYVPMILQVAVGALIGWLVLVTAKHERTVKSAVLEFIIVGGLAFYLATTHIFYFLLPVITSFRPGLGWILMDRNLTAITMGSVLFGYELLMFIVRMIRFRKNKKELVLETD
jgi:hypothetical protein